MVRPPTDHPSLTVARLRGAVCAAADHFQRPPQRGAVSHSP